MKIAFSRHRSSKGFSLVEIALALGILAFALTGIVGLLSGTLKSAKSSMDDLTISEMTGDIVNSLRKQKFEEINANKTDVFFDVSGKRINEVDATTGVIKPMATTVAVSRGAIYVCVPTIVSDSTMEVTKNSIVEPNLWRITLVFRWPAGAASSPNRKTFHADIARY